MDTTNLPTPSPEAGHNEGASPDPPGPKVNSFRMIAGTLGVVYGATRSVTATLALAVLAAVLTWVLSKRIR